MRFKSPDVTWKVYWDDLRFPAGAVNPPGLASDPDFDTTNGGWLFAGGGTELLFFQAQLPHSWVNGSYLQPHVHWQKTTSAAGTVKWQLDYKWAPIGEVMDAAFTTDAVTAPVAGTPDNDTANEHLISAFSSIDAAGKSISDMLLVKISRIGGDDTYAADARLLEFDIHYQKNAFGSVLEYSREP
jgi:hypothetical protein